MIEELKRGPGKPVRQVNGEQKVSSETCPVCKTVSHPIVCLLVRTVTDQRGIGYKGLICPGCGTVRVARGRDGHFIFGYQEKWHEQE